MPWEGANGLLPGRGEPPPGAPPGRGPRGPGVGRSPRVSPRPSPRPVARRGRPAPAGGRGRDARRGPGSEPGPEPRRRRSGGDALRRGRRRGRHGRDAAGRRDRAGARRRTAARTRGRARARTRGCGDAARRGRRTRGPGPGWAEPRAPDRRPGSACSGAPGPRVRTARPGASGVRTSGAGAGRAGAGWALRAAGCRGRLGGGRRRTRRPLAAGGRDLLRELLAQLADHGRLDGRRRRPHELPELLELGHHDLALDSELLRELVDPDLCHVSPVSVRAQRQARTVVTGVGRSSLGAHRVLISVRPAFRLDGSGGLTARASGPGIGAPRGGDVLPHGRRSSGPLRRKARANARRRSARSRQAGVGMQRGTTPGPPVARVGDDGPETVDLGRDHSQQDGPVVTVPTPHARAYRPRNGTCGVRGLPDRVTGLGKHSPRKRLVVPGGHGLIGHPGRRGRFRTLGTRHPTALVTGAGAATARRRPAAGTRRRPGRHGCRRTPP